MTNRELLTIDEVAQFLRISPMTVYRWCWAGKLPGIKIGKEWRIARADLDSFLASRKGGPEPASLEDVFRRRLAAPEHVLVMASAPDQVYRLQARYMEVGLKAGHPLFIAAWWQRPEDLRERLTEAGLPVAELEANGRLAIGDLWAAYQAGGPRASVDLWRQQAQAASGRLLWGTGSHRLAEWDGRLEELLRFETELHSAFQSLPVVALCPCLLDPVERPGFETLLDLVPHHSGVLFATGDEPVLLRAGG